jgi:hypothetical protein
MGGASAWGVVVGLAPHVLHHVGPLAGAALLAGLGGKALFFALSIVLSLPLLRRLHRRFGTLVALAVPGSAWSSAGGRGTVAAGCRETKAPPVFLSTRRWTHPPGGPSPPRIPSFFVRVSRHRQWSNTRGADCRPWRHSARSTTLDWLSSEFRGTVMKRCPAEDDRGALPVGRGDLERGDDPVISLRATGPEQSRATRPGASSPRLRGTTSSSLKRRSQRCTRSPLKSEIARSFTMAGASRREAHAAGDYGALHRRERHRQDDGGRSARR